MTDSKLRTPVAFFVFNRPETTMRVLERIEEAHPSLLLVISDGARAWKQEEHARCQKVRDLIASISWPCEVRTLCADTNLGCRQRISTGLDWVFSQVEEAIILEDDCLPIAEFFPFCETLLHRYRDDERVGMISGTNLMLGHPAGTGSYYYSRYASIWGWASWRRAWRYYDVNAAIWPDFFRSGAFDKLVESEERWYWISAFEEVFRKRIDTWDYQWMLACWAHSMLAVVPEQNLISNIGFGPTATHTGQINRYANLAPGRLSWPLMPPKMISANRRADVKVAEQMFSQTLSRRLRYMFRYPDLIGNPV